MPERMIVAIATHGGRLPLLRTLLESLSCAIKPAGYARTIVVENGPRHGVEGLISEFAPLNPTYLHVPEANRSRALNAVLDRVSGDRDLLVMFDDDIRVNPYTLVAYATGACPATFSGGPLIADWEQPPPKWLMPFLPASATGWNAGARIERDTKCGFLGGNWAAFAGDLIRAGGFDLRVGPGARVSTVGDETRLQSALRKLGVRPTYLPDAIVWHRVPMSQCSPEWTLRRAFQTGASAGLTEAQQLRRAQLRLLQAKYLLRMTDCRVRALASPHHLERFKARWQLSKWSGKLFGSRQADAVTSTGRPSSPLTDLANAGLRP